MQMPQLNELHLLNQKRLLSLGREEPDLAFSTEWNVTKVTSYASYVEQIWTTWSNKAVQKFGP